MGSLEHSDVAVIVGLRSRIARRSPAVAPPPLVLICLMVVTAGSRGSDKQTVVGISAMTDAALKIRWSKDAYFIIPTKGNKYYIYTIIT